MPDRKDSSYSEIRPVGKGFYEIVTIERKLIRAAEVPTQAPLVPSRKARGTIPPPLPAELPKAGLISLDVEPTRTCDRCGTVSEPGTRRQECRECGKYVCKDCSIRGGRVAKGKRKGITRWAVCLDCAASMTTPPR